MFTTHIEKFCGNFISLLPIFDIHYRELSEHFKQNINLAPDYKRYARIESEDKLIFITLREQGDLVGYFSGFIDTALHYQNCLTLHLDLFYVLPTYRGQRENQNGGVMLLDAVKKEAARRGVRAWTMGRKVRRGKHMEKLLLDAGFEPFEVHYVYWF